MSRNSPPGTETHHKVHVVIQMTGRLSLGLTVASISIHQSSLIRGSDGHVVADSAALKCTKGTKAIKGTVEYKAA